MAPPPLVTGISPKEGPPGTLVTVRGDFLGNSPTDLLGLTICGCDCLLSAEWKSPKKILARSGPGKGRGDIIITTRSGGKGTSTVQFRGYHETIGPMKESAVWVEEAPLQALVWSRRSLSPSAYQQEDPLGLSVEGSEHKLPEDDLHELFPDGSGDLASENFSAGWFLLEHHSTTTFDDLKAGLAFLRRKVEGHKEGQLSFLKTNVGSVMEQLDTLAALKERFEEDMDLQGPDPTAKVEEAIQESMAEANKLFEDVLARRDRADATRNALAVLQRYKFLFCLPVAIERNVRKGDFDIIINDYSRVRNLFGETDIGVFRRVLLEVEQRIQGVRDLLWERLRDEDSSLDEQKHIIRNLVSLEAEGDPAWEAVGCHAAFLHKRLEDCRERHMQAEQMTNEEGKSGKGSAGKTKSAAVAEPNSVPQRVLFVEEVCQALSERFPDLWKLGQAYFSGELHVTVGPTRDSDFKRMVLGAMDHFCRLLRGALLPSRGIRGGSGAVMGTKGDGGGSMWGTGADVSAWLPHCLRCVRSAYASLIALDLPAEALDVVAQLITDLRMHSLSTLFRQAADSIRALHQQENWKPVFESGHPGGISDLPQQFEQLVVQTLQRAQEAVLTGAAREKPLLGDSVAQRELNALAQALLLAFPQALETLAFSSDGSQEDRSPNVSQLIGSPAVYRSSEKEASGPPWEQRLLITLGNCQFTTRIILPRLSEAFPRHGCPAPTLPLASAASALNALDKRILEVYLEQKSDPLVGTIEPSMYLGLFDWDTPRCPTDVSPYAKEILANMNGVHAEVQRVSPALVSRVLSQIVETVAEELARLMACVKRFSPEGRQQASADIAFLRAAVNRFTSPAAERFFDEALEAIPPLSSPEEKSCAESAASRARTAMRLQLLSLGAATGSVTGAQGISATA